MSEVDVEPSTELVQPRPTGVRWRTVVGSVAFVVAATAAQLFRQAGTPMWRTVWAEDGTRFYQDALEEPLREIIFRSYAGYGHVLPRILGDIGSLLPPQYFSKWAALSSTSIVALLALFTYFASEPLLRAPLRRAILACSIFLLPVLPIEILGVICNLHWILPTACFFAVLFPVDRPWPIAARLAIVILGPLSSPLCLVFAPIVAVQLVLFVLRRRRGQHDSTAALVVPVAYLLAVLAQLAIYARAPKLPKVEVSLSEEIDAIIRLYPTKVGTNLVFGVRVSNDLWERYGYLVAAAAMLILGALLLWKFVRSDSTARIWLVSLVAGGAAIFVYSMVARPELLESMVPLSRTYNFLGARYEVFPAFLLVIALLLPSTTSRGLLTSTAPARPPTEAKLVGARAEDRSALERVTGGLPWRSLVVVTLAWCVVAVVPSYRQTTYRSSGPSWYAEYTESRNECLSDPTLDDERLEISPSPDWGVDYTCDELDVHRDSQG